MYTVVLGFDNLTEVYQVSDYNKDVKESMEEMSTYGVDCVELVVKGILVTTQYQIFRIEDMIKRFDDFGIEDYTNDQVNKWKCTLREVAMK